MKSVCRTCYLDKAEGSPIYVAHLFGENIPTGKGRDTDYKALEDAVINLKIIARQHRLPAAVPGYLGCGLTIVYLMDSVKMLWQEFGDVPMDPETERIEEDWHGFKKSTCREEIWHWFEDTFDVRVVDLLYGKGGEADV